MKNLWILGVPPDWLEASNAGDYWFSEKEREILSAEFSVRSGLQVRQERIAALRAWIAGAERVSDTNADQHVYTNWFDKNQFVVQPAFTLRRTSSRIADIRGPGIKKIDMTVSKKVMISERVSMRFQAEFYNAPNHPIFSSPQTSVTNANFTRITGTALAPRNIQLSGRISF